MAENSNIEWTDHTFNPWIGCTKVSPGCDHCYAETWDARGLQRGPTRWGPHAARTRTSPANWRKPLAWNRAAKAAPARGPCTPTGRGLCATSARRRACRSFLSNGGEWMGVGPGPIREGGCTGLKSWGDGRYSVRVGKKNAARILDGRTWDQLPPPSRAADGDAAGATRPADGKTLGRAG
jgi:hypothetical protein